MLHFFLRYLVGMLVYLVGMLVTAFALMLC